MTEVKTATIVYRGEVLDGYKVTSDGKVINTKLKRELTATFNQDRKIPYISMTIDGNKIRPSLPVLVYNAFNKDDQVQVVSQLGFRDGDSANVSIDNLYRKDMPATVTINKAEIKDEVMTIELNEYTSDELEFAKLQREFINLLGSNGISKRIRQNAMGKSYTLFNTANEETIERYELEYIMDVQRSKSIYQLPLFKSETLLGIYHEYCDLLPVINSNNINELVYLYIEDMKANAIISLDVTHKDMVVTLKDFSSDNLTYSVLVDPLDPIKSLLSIIRLRNILSTNFNPETLIPLY